jgi:hypothetical protein
MGEKTPEPNPPEIPPREPVEPADPPTREDPTRDVPPPVPIDA